MGQEFHVVRCYSCATFQSHQVRKDKKFVCKLCGEKQSVRKEYGRGSGKDCRIHVQKLNSIRKSLEEEQKTAFEAHLEEKSEWQALEHRTDEEGDGDIVSVASTSVSKWSKYLSSDSEEEEEEEEKGSAMTASQPSPSIPGKTNRE